PRPTDTQQIKRENQTLENDDGTGAKIVDCHLREAENGVHGEGSEVVENKADLSSAQESGADKCRNNERPESSARRQGTSKNGRHLERNFRQVHFNSLFPSLAGENVLRCTESQVHVP